MSPKLVNLPPGAPRLIAFQDGKCLGDGSETTVARALAAQSVPSATPILVFDADSGEQVELPRRPVGPAGQPEPAPPPRPGRPRLGVVAREVTLLPRDWAWLEAQPGGPSVTLRKLVLSAQRQSEQANRKHAARVACYRFMSAIAGNEPAYEEALRALFRDDARSFADHTVLWPADVRAQAQLLAGRAFDAPDGKCNASNEAPATGAAA